MRAVAIACVLAATAAAGEPVALGPCGPVGRRYDAVELPVVQLRRLGGTPLARVGVVAFRDGAASPIPFQIDERRGRKVALPDGPEPTTDDKPGVLDADDAVVIMACDAGEARTPAEVDAALADAGTSAWREVRVTDPLTGKAAAAYVVVAERPPTTDRCYVAYDGAVDMVQTGAYRVGLVRALPVYLALGMHGPIGPNILDGLRMRAEARLRADLAHWKLNEQQGYHQLISWKVGPIRAVRRSRHGVVLGFGIRLTAGIAYTSFYPQHVFGPGSMKLPFSPSVFFRDITAFGGADGRDLRGWRYRAPGVPPEGFLVDGRMDDAERAFSGTGTGEWFSLTHDGEGILFVLRTSENLARAIPLRLAYRDDAATPNPPETEPGTLPLVGFEGRGVERLQSGRYTFSVGVYGLASDAPGEERRVLAELETPPTIEVAAERGLSVRGAPATGPPAPR